MGIMIEMTMRLILTLLLFSPFVLAQLQPAFTRANLLNTPTLPIESCQFQGIDGSIEDVKLPHNWNVSSEIQQGTVWYRCPIDFNQPINKKSDYLLDFEGIFKEGEVWFNGTKLAAVQLPYLPFRIKINSWLKEGKNLLEIKINNQLNRHSLPTSTTLQGKNMGWFPYAGITRPLRLLQLPKNYPQQVLIDARTSGKIAIRFDSKTQKDLEILSPTGESLYHYKHSGEEVFITIYSPKIWGPQTSKNIYTLIVDGIGHFQFGFRDFEVTHNKLWLNGDDFYIKGINRHDDHPIYGAIYSPSTFKEDLDNMVELGVNFTRPGHYPIIASSLDLLQDSGILVALEMPAYQLDTISFANKDLQKQVQDYAYRMTSYYYNFPNITIWSMGNELLSWLPGANAFVKKIKSSIRLVDPYRPTMLAVLSMPPAIQKILAKEKTSTNAEILGLNLYHGWYYSQVVDASKTIKLYSKWYPKQVLFISEYGAGSVPNKKLTKKNILDKKNKYTQEFQNQFLIETTQLFKSFPRLRGYMPWVLNDFRYQWKVGNDQCQPDGMNVKGLLDFERRPKPAFYIMKDLNQSL